MVKYAKVKGPQVLRKLLAYPTVIVDALVKAVGKDQIRRSMLCGQLRFGTLFSGMCTTEQALRILKCELKRHDIEFQPSLQYTCDIDRSCQKVCGQFQKC